jgi:hypothetical protein
MVAWTEYTKTDDFANSKRWAVHPQHMEGSLWAAFAKGFAMATERAAALHESVNPASDDERLNKVPGAGGMGAVIQYRDMIRTTE